MSFAAVLCGRLRLPTWSADGGGPRFELPWRWAWF